jgi:hypothetical protein
MKTKHLLARLEALEDTLISSAPAQETLRDCLIELLDIVRVLAEKQRDDARSDEV